MTTLKQLEALMAQASPLPWRNLQGRNGKLIEAAVSALPSLIAALRQAREQIDQYKTGHEGPEYYNVLNKLRELEGE